MSAATLITAAQLLDDEELSNVKVLLSLDYSFALGDLYMSWVNISNVLDARIEIAITDQPDCESAQVNKDTYACNDESNCQNLPSGRGYQCQCPSYMQGNPYVRDGCIQGPYFVASSSLLWFFYNLFDMYIFLEFNADE